MSTMKLDGIDYNADQQVINHLDKTVVTLKAAEKKADETQAKLDGTQAKLDTANAKIKELEKKDTSAEVSAAVKSRLSLERQANTPLDEKELEKLDSMTDAEIRSAIILKAFPKADEQLKDKSDDYLNARFDSALEIYNFVY